ncbi:hypothetical protein CLU79DRAFT_759333 [Phycomyces nitens]|nr:hypothetical protein CLU79DRAFT_759333 [Phycomyces nitens]
MRMRFFVLSTIVDPCCGWLTTDSGFPRDFHCTLFNSVIEISQILLVLWVHTKGARKPNGSK